jgi:Holliday junction resolvase
MGKLSRDKGKRGEREIVDLLKKRGWPARRGQQFKGTPDSPDVECPNFPFHIEVKRTERLSVYEAMAQAEQDAGTRAPVVFHRRSNEKWLAILDLEEFLALIED